MSNRPSCTHSGELVDPTFESMQRFLKGYFQPGLTLYSEVEFTGGAPLNEMVHTLAIGVALGWYKFATCSNCNDFVFQIGERHPNK